MKLTITIDHCPYIIYKYIYTSADPSIPCTEHVRLCVERNKHSWSCPVKRLRSRGAERAQAPMSSAPAEPSRFDLGNVSRCRVFEQPGRAISSGLAEPSKFQWAPSSFSIWGPPNYHSSLAPIPQTCYPVWLIGCVIPIFAAMLQVRKMLRRLDIETFRTIDIC